MFRGLHREGFSERAHFLLFIILLLKMNFIENFPKDLYDLS